MKKKYFDLAKRITGKSSHHTHKLACVIVNGNRVISVGWNQLKTHPRSTHPYKSLHAELHAIIGCSEGELAGSEMYVYRELKDGRMAMAKPCKYCMEALRLAKIKKVWYTVSDGTEGEDT